MNSRWGGDGQPTPKAAKIQRRNKSKLPKITENEFTAQVIQLAQACGWRVAHFRPARTATGWRTAVQGDGKGFPDLVLAHKERGRVIFAELKVGNNKPSPEQNDWLQTLAAVSISAGVSVYLWTPDDWPEIERELACKP